jgi:SAM-dependent methyltransferase
MFTESAQWYDALYSFKDYEKESAEIIARLQEEHPQAKSVLDVACGTAEHDRYLAKTYRVDGLDLNPEFIRVAETKNPAGKYYCADMTDFELDKGYDAILCLFSSIGYVKTVAKLVETLACFRRHLNPAGVILVEAWFTPQAWNPGESVHMLTAETDQGKICRMNLSEQDGSLSIINFHYLVGTRAGIRHFTELHELGLFAVDEMLAAFETAQLEVSYDEQGLMDRGLYTARAQA